MSSRERKTERQTQREIGRQSQRKCIFCLAKCFIAAKDMALRYLEMPAAVFFLPPKILSKKSTLITTAGFLCLMGKDETFYCYE